MIQLVQVHMIQNICITFCKNRQKKNCNFVPYTKTTSQRTDFSNAKYAYLPGPGSYNYVNSVAKSRLKIKKTPQKKVHHSSQELKNAFYMATRIYQDQVLFQF